MLAPSLARTAAGALLAVALTAPSPAADVIVVDKSGQGDTTTFIQAVLVAQSGDTILIRPGDYSGDAGGGIVAVNDKSLVIVGDGDVTLGRVWISSLTSGPLLLRGVDLEAPANSQYPALLVTDSTSEIWIEDCALSGNDGFFTLQALPGTPGAAVTDSPRVSFARSSLVGGGGVDSFFPYAPTPGAGAPGLLVTSSAVTLHDCALGGGDGGDFVGFAGEPGAGGNGGPGLRGVDADVLASGCTFAGGDGGFGDELDPTPGAYAGGDGIELDADSALRELLGTVLTPGVGGLDGLGQPGPSGQPRDVAGSQLVYQAAPRTLSVESPTREGTSVALDYDGRPGDLFGLYVSLGPGALPLNAGKGTWLLGGPLVGSFVLGTADADGDLDLVVPLPDFGLTPGQSVTLFEQAYVLGATDGKVLSGPSAHVIVDDGV